MEGIALIMAACAQALIGVFKLSGNSTLDYFFGVFNGNISTSGQHDAGIFGGFYKLCLYSALAIIFISMIYQIFKAFFGPLANAESPSRVVFKSVFFGLLAANAQNLVAFVFEIAQIPYDAVSQNVSVDLGHITSAMAQNTYTELDTAVSSLGGAATVFLTSTWGTVLSIILFFMLLKNFLALALELGERYLMLGILTIIAPLCIACGAVRGLEEVFKNWLSWVINGCIVMIFTTFFLSVFITTFVARAEITYLILWIAWFKTGQKIDEHMNALGLKTAKSGGFGMDLMTGLINGVPAALGTYNKVAGTNFGSPLHKLMGRPDGSDPSKGKGAFNTLGLKDPSTGNGGNRGVRGMLTNNKLAKKLGETNAGQTASKALTSAGVAARKAANTTKDALMGSGVGQASGLSHSQLKDIASGKMQAPSKNNAEQYDNVMKDIARMQGGKEASDWLDNNKGMKVTDAKFDKEGNISAELSDGTKSARIGFASAGNDTNAVVGEDGEKRQFKVETNDSPDNRIDNSAFNPNDSMQDDKSNLLGASDTTMEQNGILENDNGTISANSEALDSALADESISNDQKEALQDIKNNGGDISFNEDGMNEDGSLKHFDSKGNEDENGDFVKDANGTLIPNAVVEDGTNTSDANNVNLNENASAGGESIQDYNNIKEADQEGLATEAGATAVTDGTGTYNLGEPDENGIITGTDGEGNTAQFKQEEDGSLTNISTGESGLQSVEGNNTVTDNNGNTYNLGEPDSNGIITGTDSAGNTAQFKQEEDGSLTKIGEAREFDQSKGITTNENGESIAYDKNTGEAFKVSDDAVHDVAKDIHGDSKNVDTSQGVSQISSINSDGTTPNAMAAVASLEGGAGTAQFNANNANITMQNSANEDFQVDTSKGLQASVSDGGFNVTATDTKGNAQSISGEGTKLNIAGNEVSSTAKVTDNNDGTYSTTNTRGEQVSFTKDDLRSAGISAQTDSSASSLNTTKTADLSRVESMAQDTSGKMVSTAERHVESISTGNGSDSSQRAVASTNTIDGNSTASFDASKTNVGMVDSGGKSFNMDTSKNMTASIQPSSSGDGMSSFNVSATDTSGTSHSLQGSSASLSINGHEVSASSKVESLGNGSYKTTDTLGREVTFNNNDLNKATISAKTDFASSTVSGSSAVSSTINSSQFRNERDISREPVICKSSSGDYFVANSTQRYDETGKANPNGEYLKSSNSEGISVLQHVGSGSIATYKYSEESSKLKFGTLNDKGNMEYTSSPSGGNNIKTTQSYSATGSYGTGSSVPTGVMSKDGRYQELYDSEPVSVSRDNGTTQMGIQKFCRAADSNDYYHLDMQKNKFDGNGHLVPAEEYYVHDGKGNSMTLKKSEIDGGAQESPYDYTRVRNDVSRGVDFRKMGSVSGGTDAHMVSSSGSYANGINTQMDLSKATTYPVKNENGTNNGQLLVKYGNEQYHFYPKGTDVSSFSNQNIGCHVTLPGGQQGYMIPDERNTMNIGLSNFGINTSKNAEYNWGTLRNLPENKRTFLRNMGVSENATNIKINTLKDGTSSIVFKSNGKTYCFKNAESKGYNNVASSGYSITGHPASYKYELNQKTPFKNLISSSTRKAYGLLTPIYAKKKKK